MKVQKFADAFVRNADGSWFCRAPGSFVVNGDARALEVTPGVTYRRGRNLVGGHDVARWLDDWAGTKVAPTGIRFL